LPSEKVYQTAQLRNYVFGASVNLAGQIYEVYLMLQRAENVPDMDLRMTIESAYLVDVPTPRPKRPNTIRFKVLAYKVLRREPVRFTVR
jgi:hypothetical protein